jgi:methionine synthase II (cobalamin-independent)
MSELKALSTTGIGSLPHASVEDALKVSFRLDIPYLPQLPKRDRREFMLAHALDGMPGIVAGDQGMITIDLEKWRKGYLEYAERLHTALEENDPSSFLPSEESSSALRPFLSRIKETKTFRAKAQIAGPMTLQWTLRTTDNLIPPAPVMSQVTRTVMAKSLALAQAMQEAGAKPVIFFDEPGLYAFSARQPNHIVLLQELKIIIMTLKKREVEVGLHCCSDADWHALMSLNLDILAIDAKLSLPSLLKSSDALLSFSSGGGQLALGVIPTSKDGIAPVSEIFTHFEERIQTLEKYFRTRASTFEKILSRSLLTPACGLALLETERAQDVHAQLAAFQSSYRSFHDQRR